MKSILRFTLALSFFLSLSAQDLLDDGPVYTELGNETFKHVYVLEGEEVIARVDSFDDGYYWSTTGEGLEISGTNGNGNIILSFTEGESALRLVDSAGEKVESVGFTSGVRNVFYLYGTSAFKDKTYFSFDTLAKTNIDIFYETAKRENIPAESVSFMSGKIAKKTFVKPFFENIEVDNKTILYLYLNTELIRYNGTNYFPTYDSVLYNGRVNTSALINADDLFARLKERGVIAVVLMLDGARDRTPRKRMFMDRVDGSTNEVMIYSMADFEAAGYLSKALEGIDHKLVLRAAKKDEKLIEKVSDFLSSRKAIDETGDDGRVTLSEFIENIGQENVYLNTLSDFKSAALTYYKWKPGGVEYSNAIEYIYEYAKVEKEYETETRNFLVFQRKYQTNLIRKVVGKEIVRKEIRQKGEWN